MPENWRVRRAPGADFAPILVVASLIDQPDAQRLLEAMADALRADVLDGDNNRAADYTVRIVANLSRILARELKLGAAFTAATVVDLEGLLGHRGTAAELVEALDHRLATAPDRLSDTVVLSLLQADVERRLAIARPDYLQPRR